MSEPIVIAPEVEALILAELAKRVRSRQNLTKALIGVGYGDGDKQTFRSPVDGRRLGTVYKTDPDPEWRVTDQQALDVWLAARDAYTETTVEIREGCEAEALAVIQQHAPGLLADVDRIRDGAAAEVLMESTRRGEAIAPGIERVKPAGVLTVRPDKAAGDAIEAMVKAGLITWDGRPALTAGDEDDPVVDVPVVRIPFRNDVPRDGGDAA